MNRYRIDVEHSDGMTVQHIIRAANRVAAENRALAAHPDGTIVVSKRLPETEAAA